MTDSNKVRVTFQLSLEPLNPQDPGYQEPLPACEVQEESFEKLKTLPQRILDDRSQGQGRTRDSGEGNRGKTEVLESGRRPGPMKDPQDSRRPRGAALRANRERFSFKVIERAVPGDNDMVVNLRVPLLSSEKGIREVHSRSSKVVLRAVGKIFPRSACG